MKTYIATLVILISSISFGQVTIGKSSPYTPANATVSLEFGNATGGARGIVLPWVTAATNVASAVPGTLIFDSNDQKVKFGTSATANATTVASWTDLSAGAYAPVVANVPDTNAEVATAKTLIGGTPSSDTTPGILVLGDTNKAMILPRVNSYTDIVNPTAGMMVYVTGTTPQQLALFNGREWSFWTKP
ncbi:hypothetical protein [Epilithonimonas arachidiradicis]|uniref:Uncharacterized protein n=1 Tax=Epilithonimonas arachidiradicis TaxID=1617282 RepID=A0A420DA63_9FLAO|nr:hypothetical protein [Epilithonimonas arachidiradicis]RKE87646.1 hypothetical protein BXY58_1773 [Epilithonimonas arachidiradicis]GGG56847.1 hypothetical protein GCM10007332_18140 [Epilithonimonas arachidiradicis]